MGTSITRLSRKFQWFAASVAVYLLPLPLLATPPVIVDGPRIQSLEKNTALLKWRTSEAAGASSTITTALGVNATGSQDRVAVAPGTGSGFPAGAVVKVDHERMRVVAQSGDNLTVQRGYDAEYLHVWEGALTSVVVASGVCTITTTISHNYVAGDKIRFLRASGIASDTTFTVNTVPTSTTFTATCPGAVNGTYTNAGLQVYEFPDVHNAGAAIKRIDSDAQVCYGTTASYGQSVKSPEEGFTTLRQSINHFVYVTALQPGTLYHFKVQSTPRGVGTSNCTSPGADTVESTDQTMTTAAAVAGDEVPAATSTNGKTWDFSSAAAFTTDLTSAANCSDLQAKINTIASADGNQNHRVLIPASATCAVNLNLPAKSGANPTGTGKLVLESSAFASLPPEGFRLNLDWHLPFLPTLYTSNTTPALHVAAKAHHWIIRGIKFTADPSRAGAFFGQDFHPATTLDGSSNDFDTAQDPNHIAFEQIYYTCPGQNNFCKGMRIHGQYLAVMDSIVGPTFGAGDLAAVQVDGYASQYIYIHNNDLSGTFSSYYQSDNALNPQDSIIERNYLHKPREWDNRSHRYQFAVQQSVASATIGSTTLLTTQAENDIQNGTPVAISGATGTWAKLNHTSWSALAGNMNVSVSGGTATVTTAAAHGLSTGMYVTYGGGHIYPCSNFSAQGGAALVTVSNTTTFTFPVSSADFSTIAGTACPSSDVTVYGPVFPATVSNNTSFLIPFNSASLGPLTGTLTAAYPRRRIVKNAFEFKTGVRALITGNVIDGSWSQDQSGQLMVMTVRGLDSFGGWPAAQGPICWSCALTIRDIDIQKNVMRNGCSGLSMLGTNPNSPVGPEYRIRFQGNLLQNLSQANSGTGTCLDTPFSINGSYSDVTFAHNTGFGDGRVIAEDATSTFPRSGNLYMRDNLIYGATSMNNGSCAGTGMVSGLNLNGCTPTYNAGDIRRNVFYGDAAARGSSDPWNFERQFFSGVTTGSAASYQANFWPNSQAGVGFVGVMTVAAATKTAPIIVTTSAAHGCTTGDMVRIADATGNTNANGLWRVRVVSSTQLALIGSIGNGILTGTPSLMPWSGSCATIASASLNNSSPYLGGTTYVAPLGPPAYGSAGSGPATDNLAVGADIGALRAAIGDVDFNGVTSGSTFLRFDYTVYAGTGEVCYIDISNNSFATFTRTADSAAGTGRLTSVGGLNPGGTYSYRLLCPSFQTSGTAVTSNPQSISFQGDVKLSGSATIRP